MAYGTPVDPVGGTVITTAYAIANILDPIRWLRLMTGNTDPPGSSYVVVSDSTTGTTWRKIPADALAAGVALANLGYAPLNRAGDTMTGDLVMTRTAAPTTGAVFFGNSGAKYLFYNGTFYQLVGGTLEVAGDLSTFRSGSPTTGFVVFGNASHFIGWDGTQFVADAGVIWTSGNAPASADVHSVQGYVPGASSGNLAILGAGGKVALAVAADSATTAGNATQVGGLTPTATPAAGAIPIADGSGKLDGWVTPASFSIPSGLGFWVRKAADIPSGFTRDTTLDGLIPIGAGTSFSQTFVEETSYGSSWQHLHGVGSQSVTVSSVTVTGSAVGGPSDVTGNNSAAGQSAGTGTNRADSPHNHSLNGVSLAVSASGTGSGATAGGNSANTTWLPPMRAVVWIRKN